MSAEPARPNDVAAIELALVAEMVRGIASLHPRFDAAPEWSHHQGAGAPERWSIAQSAAHQLVPAVAHVAAAQLFDDSVRMVAAAGNGQPSDLVDGTRPMLTAHAGFLVERSAERVKIASRLVEDWVLSAAALHAADTCRAIQLVVLIGHLETEDAARHAAVQAARIEWCDDLVRWAYHLSATSLARSVLAEVLRHRLVEFESPAVARESPTSGMVFELRDRLRSWLSRI